MGRIFRTLRIVSLSAFLLAQAAFFGVPIASAQTTYPCFMKEECLQGPATAGPNCNEKYCFEASRGGPGECTGTQGFCYANPPTIPLTVNIGGATEVRNIGDYIQTVYTYGVSVAGVIAAVTMVIGGFQYLTGHPKEGKSKIHRSLLGLTLVFGAYVILLTINPDLVRLTLPKVPIIKKAYTAACAGSEAFYACGVPYKVIHKPGSTSGASNVIQATRDNTILASEPVPAGAEVVAECVGQGCGMETMKGTGGNTCSSGAYKCARAKVGVDSTYQCGGKPSGAVEGYFCKQCSSASDTACGANGPTDVCCSGFCLNGKCASGDVGAKCSKKDDCNPGLFCDTHFTNRCTTGEVGMSCSSKEECKDGLFCDTEENVCTTGQMYSRCDGDNECGTGHCVQYSGLLDLLGNLLSVGVTDLGEGGVCLPAGRSNITYCDTDGKNTEDCGSDGGYCFDEKFCTNGSLGAPCASDSGCASNKCSGKVCVSGLPGSACDADKDCVDGGFCATSTLNSSVRFCTKLAGEHTDCRSDKDCLPDYACYQDGSVGKICQPKQ